MFVVVLPAAGETMLSGIYGGSTKPCPGSSAHIDARAAAHFAASQLAKIILLTALQLTAARNILVTVLQLNATQSCCNPMG